MELFLLLLKIPLLKEIVLGILGFAGIWFAAKRSANKGQQAKEWKEAYKRAQKRQKLDSDIRSKSDNDINSMLRPWFRK